MIPSGVQGVVWDWGDTLMRVIPGQKGPMVDWPRVEVMPGASSALSALSVLSVQCVASNATESDSTMIAEALERVGIREYFSYFFTSSELGSSKPNPQFFEMVSQELAISPTRLMAIGDDFEKDIVPAKAVGMATVLVSSAPVPASRDTADLIVPNLSCLAELFR